MKARQLVKIGYYIPLEYTFFETYVAHLSNKKRHWAQILMTLSDYLVKYSKQFDGVSLIFTSQLSSILPNGTCLGVHGLVNRSQVDIGFPPTQLREENIDIFDHSYPYKLTSFTFLTPKPQYKPQIFGILHTFAVSLWMAVLLAIMAMILAYYVVFKRKCSLHRIFLHVFAVFLKQNSIICHSSIVEKLLLYSWVVGAMFLCFAFDSVFLSYLAIPTVTKIKDVAQLATAVANGEYHCIDFHSKGTRNILQQSNSESLRILGKDIETNLENIEFMKDFIDGKIHNFAIVLETDFVDMFARSSFVSEDRFLEYMSAMPLRKGFCCKKILNTFVHRLMASGLFFKYYRDSAFLIQLPNSLKHQEEDNNKRKLTITDVAPAFTFLLSGYIISFFVFIGEVLSNCWKKTKQSKIVKRSEKRKVYIDDAV